MLLPACATSAALREMVMKRAPFDLQCGRDQLVVTELDARGYTRVYGVIGCRRRATYTVVCVDRAIKSTCSAVLEQVRPDLGGPAQPAAAPQQ
jgi:hypothetical protein